MKIRTYIINLKESKERRERVAGLVSCYPCMDVEWIDAINGREMSAADRDRLFDSVRFSYRYGCYPSPGIIGCTLSHRECYRKLVESDEEVALILEDDVQFFIPEDVEKVLTAAADFLKKKGKGVMSFYSFRHISMTKGKLLTPGYLRYRMWYSVAASVYLVHRNSAEKLLTDTPPSVVADDFQFMNLKGIPVYSISPRFAGDLSGSQIIETEIEMVEVKKISKNEIPLKYRLQNLFRGGCRRSMLVLGIMSVKKE